ncbi:hypothetical protein BDB00DRAFT_749805, partial [Zychaea mexicana]|uniref:uncharacterized protein n=1 Tax=Zychaea mexicana TaxID=64656 RepID=UPI0022FDD6FD
QEHNVTPPYYHNIDLHLQSHQSLWTPHCALFSLDSNIQLHLVNSYLSGRVLLARVTYTNNTIDPFYIICIYAPATYSPRRQFYHELSTTWSTIASTSILRRCFLMGDFNLQLHRHTNHCSAWRDIISQHFTDCITEPGDKPLPTFRSHCARTTIDYIFRSSELISTTPNVHYLNSSEWTDHCLVTTALPLPFRTGPGNWRLHPHYLTHDDYVEKLDHLFDVIQNDPTTNNHSPQDQWDNLKAAVKQLSITYGRHLKRSHQQTQHLYRERLRILRKQQPNRDRLQAIESTIASKQLDDMATLALRAKQRW